MITNFILKLIDLFESFSFVKYATGNKVFFDSVSKVCNIDHIRKYYIRTFS